jgi:hypothetical protein
MPTHFLPGANVVAVTRSPTGRRSARPWLLRAAGLALATSCGAAWGAQPDQALQPSGGLGGGGFSARCELNEVLAGFELRAGDDVDAIRPICVVPYSADAVGARRPHVQLFGGPGGAFAQVVCPVNTPVVVGLAIGSEGVRIESVNSLHLFCGRAAPNQNLGAYPTAKFDAPWKVLTDAEPLQGSDPVFQHWDTEQCPAGLVAVGINGRSGKWLDAVGLTCGELHLTYVPGGGPVKSLGRVAPSSSPSPPRPICDAARDARARNSPAAPGLEAQCLASQPPPKSLGRVQTPFVTPPGSARPICDVAQEARARNSPAAPGLEAQCRADLAVRGAAIAEQDPLSAELRRRARNDISRRGFDIGMAAAQGNTMPGPGKQAIHDALNGIEQAAYDAAVSFSLQRNRNAQLAATGAAIAQADPGVAQARTADPDVFYWLGFDIATGIFGDPASGALGNTATGPGSLGIRDALSAPAQRGFNAAVALHLSRHYARTPPAPANVPPAVPVVLPVGNNPGVRSAVVISQVYGGGGTVEAPFASDFVELLNRGEEPVDVTGWSIQYASSNGATWQVTPLAGAILPGHYFLIQESTGAGVGSPLGPFDLMGRINLAANSGKVALIRSSAALNGICPASADLVDFVGYGSANCTEGGRPMAELGRATVALRNAAGCSDTDSTAMDFQLAMPRPRNQATAPIDCRAGQAAQ